MKRRCIDPMTDEWQEWNEPAIEIVRGFYARQDKQAISFRISLVVVLVVCFAAYVSAIGSFATRTTDTEQASLDRGYVWMMEDGR